MNMERPLDKNLVSQSLPPKEELGNSLDLDNQVIPANVRQFFNGVRRRALQAQYGADAINQHIPNLEVPGQRKIEFLVQQNNGQYNLFEKSAESHEGHPTTERELATFKQDGSTMTTAETEYFATINGSPVIRETNQKISESSGLSLTITDVYQGPTADHLTSPTTLEQISHKESSLGPDGKEVSSQTVNFRYAPDGTLKGEEIIKGTTNPSRTETITFQQTNAGKLVPVSDDVTPPERK